MSCHNLISELKSCVKIEIYSGHLRFEPDGGTALNSFKML